MSLAFKHMPAKVLQALLIAAGQAADPDTLPLGSWPVYVDREPGTPDDCITLYDATPIDMGSDFVDRTFYPGVTVRVRSATPQVGFDKAAEIAHYIDITLSRVVVLIVPNTYLVETGSVPGGLPVRLGKESPTSQRSLFNVNCILTMRRIT